MSPTTSTRTDKIALTFILCMSLIVFLLQRQEDSYHKCIERLSCSRQFIFNLNLYLHMFCHAYSLYGFLFDNVYLLLIYLVSMPLIIYGWYMYNKNPYFQPACTLNMLSDYICDVQPHQTIKFMEVFRYLGVPTVKFTGTGRISVAYIVLGLIGWSIALCKLRKRLRPT